MKRSLLLIGVVAGFALGWLVAGPPAPHRAEASPTMTADSAAPPSLESGAPSEGTCADCHGGGINNRGSGQIAIAPPATYTPGQTYTIAVGIEQTGATRWGFEATALKADESMAGTFADIGSPGTYTGVITQASPFLRRWVGHSRATLDGTFAGMPSPQGWAFNWTAPPQGSGTVTFYVAGVAANNNGSEDAGDSTYTYTVTSGEDTGTPVRQTTWGAIKNRYR